MNATAPSASKPDPMVGQIVAGKYRLDAKLGAGAMGTVYRATDARGALCAVKILQDEIADDETRERFRREAEALFELKHPNILEVRDYGVWAPPGVDAQRSTPYLVMELLQGRTLEEMVVEHTPDPQTGLELGKQVLRGLAHAHKAGVLHRDLKTENVFVTWDGQHWVAKLLDFGLVKFTDDKKWGPAKKLTMQGAVFGSPAYMSPEQATGTPVDARSDVYSFGIMLFEMLTGSWPFEVESQHEMLKAHLLEPVPPLSTKREGLTVLPALEQIVQRALAKKPSDRFANAPEMLAALEALPTPAAWISGLTHVPPQPIAPPPAMHAPAMDHAHEADASPTKSLAILGIAAGVGVLVLLVLVAAFFALR
ncbi:serine/threonine-protein kinase [Sandaracinus amylolyticus]|uniref:Serine/threonine protein kinase n=1 Tax=Sandaracinus amylolyticus TaxID=927083 RepID=A0A0F6SDE9_9BACT|nr:serine/threonine-protein kinase [Sandaracinus amylolyticus]AKF03324.1 Serine/threonine protein kinase [Sandaracinus amylolyticus]